MASEKTEPRCWDEVYLHAKQSKTPKVVKLLARFIPVPKSRFERRIHKIASDENIKVTLEAGCGEGRFVASLAHLVSLSVGVDFSRGAIYGTIEHKTLTATEDNTFLCLAEIESLPFVDNTFDLILSLGVIEHFKNPLPLLREMRRVLKPSGLLFLEVPNRKGFGRTQRWIESDRRIFGYHDFYTHEELSVVTSKAGFKVNKAYSADFAVAVEWWYRGYIAGTLLPNKGVLKYINLAIALMLEWFCCPLNSVLKHRGAFNIVEATK